jgi:hypothetical protein
MSRRSGSDEAPHAKFIQITVSPGGDGDDFIYALDEGGLVWRLYTNETVWEQLPTEREEPE